MNNFSFGFTPYLILTGATLLYIANHLLYKAPCDLKYLQK